MALKILGKENQKNLKGEIEMMIKGHGVGYWAWKVVEWCLDCIGFGCLAFFLMGQTDPTAFDIFDMLRTKNLSGIYHEERTDTTWQFRRDVLVMYNEFGAPYEIMKFSVSGNTIYCLPINSSIEGSDPDNTMQLRMRITRKQDGNLILHLKSGEESILKKQESATTILRKIVSF